MADIADEDLQILPLTDSSQIETFNSTNEDLNDFLRNDALKSQENLLTRTFLCFYKGLLVGFYEKFGFKAIGKYLNRRYPPMYLNMYPIVLRLRLS